MAGLSAGPQRSFPDAGYRNSPFYGAESLGDSSGHLDHGVLPGFVQNAATQNVFIFFFVGLEVITAVIVIILLKFLNVEKDIEKEQEEIKARKENGGKL